jgi:MFS family permease
MVTDWFADREIVTAMGVFLASWPFGIVLGLLFQGAIAHDIGWRWVMHLAAAVCLLALVLLATACGRANLAIIAFSAIAACALGLLPAGVFLLPLCLLHHSSRARNPNPVCLKKA